jgi:SM-20-related protein
LPNALSPLQEKIIQAIAVTGCYIGESILTPGCVVGLREALLGVQQPLVTPLSPARISRTGALVPQWRGDSTSWLAEAPSNPAEGSAVLAINALRLAFNATLFTGLQHTQLHYAHYPIGAFYKRHVDRFADDSGRVISLVFYLNENWIEGDGGELVLYGLEQQAQFRVPPCAGTMVAFRSEQFPHEVLPTHKARLSLTGWMLTA